jgi:hypothetical protein
MSTRTSYVQVGHLDGIFSVDTVSGVRQIGLWDRSYPVTRIVISSAESDDGAASWMTEQPNEQRCMQDRDAFHLVE